MELLGFSCTKTMLYIQYHSLKHSLFVVNCRRQVFWISKQILQLVMEDAIDDWLLRQIHCLRSEDNIAQGIRWIQDVSEMSSLLSIQSVKFPFSFHFSGICFAYELAGSCFLIEFFILGYLAQWYILPAVKYSN